MAKPLSDDVLRLYARVADLLAAETPPVDPDDARAGAAAIRSLLNEVERLQHLEGTAAYLADAAIKAPGSDPTLRRIAQETLDSLKPV